MSTPRLLAISTHPVQYAAPQFRALDADGGVDLTVAFLSMHGLANEVDPEFGVPVRWDVSLLDSYKWVSLKNFSPSASVTGFFGLVNPGIWGLIRSGEFDLTICYGYRSVSFWIAAAACRLSGVALVWSADATSTRPRVGGGWKALLKRIIIPRIYKAADGVLAPSNRAVGFVKSLGVPRSRVFLVPYVVDNDYFAARAAVVDRSAVRTELGIAENAFAALFVGKLVPWKRPWDLLRAAAAAPGVHCLIVGEGPERDRLEKLAIDLGLNDRVTFLGFQNQSELPALYASADILVLPSEYEAFGLVVNEAFACGLPAAVSTACGCVGDLVVEGATGYTFAPGDVQALATVLESIACDRDRLQLLREGARARIQTWGTEAWVDSMVDAMAVLTRRARKRSS
jgi:glycosyltransferase involved in cell wall biosynthesis